MSKIRREKPRYLQLAEHFTECIARGEYPVGGLLPTELEICETFSVSRHTARAALSQLSNAGLVRRRTGDGTRVLMPRAAMGYQFSVETIEDLFQYGKQTRLDVHSARRDVADAELATQLGIADQAPVLMLEAVRTDANSGQAMSWIDIAVPLVRGVPAERLLDLQQAARAIERLVDMAGLTHVEQVFDSTCLPDNAALALGTGAGGPAMRVRRHYRGSDSRVLAYAVSLHPAGMLSYRIVLSRRS